MTLIEFLCAHGGQEGKHLIQIGNELSTNKKDGSKFVSLQTVDNACYLQFASTQFQPNEIATPDKVRALLASQGRNFDVLQGETKPNADGSVKACYTIVYHRDFYSYFTF